jgi:putative aminopeptidase FrvX
MVLINLLLAAQLAIPADNLRAHVSFLASDALAGRPTPSKELDTAAEYIASQFRSMGLDPVLQGETAKNVVAVLRGSDSILRDTYVVVSAHYDHIGTKKDCKQGDCIYNGANDDASGVAAMLETARALAKDTPKRSIVFAAWYGEELGFHGSQYYVKHPLVPLAKTVAMLNLEQIGRTDDKRGPQIRRLGITGPEYSDLTARLKAAAAEDGVEVSGPPQPNDFFLRSDNEPFAEAGVPAHTICVAFEFPDYHGLADEWQKLDYDNMAKVTSAIADGVLAIANDPVAPRWLTRFEAPREASRPESGSSQPSQSRSRSAPLKSRSRPAATARSGTARSTGASSPPSKSRSPAGSP